MFLPFYADGLIHETWTQGFCGITCLCHPTHDYRIMKFNDIKLELHRWPQNLNSDIDEMLSIIVLYIFVLLDCNFIPASFIASYLSLIHI